MKRLFVNFENKNNGCYSRILLKNTKEYENLETYSEMKEYALKHGKQLKNVFLWDVKYQENGSYLNYFKNGQEIDEVEGLTEIGKGLFQNKGSMFTLRVNKIMATHDFGWIDETEIEEISIFNGDIIKWHSGSPSDFARIEVFRR